MRWMMIIVLYVLGSLVTADSYQTKYKVRYNDKPNWYQTMPLCIFWPLMSPMLYTLDWSKIKEKS